MRPVRIAIACHRALLLALHLLLGAALALPYPYFDRAWRGAILRWWSRDLLAILKVHLHASSQQMPPHPQVVVCNHISWLDILVLNALKPMRFIAKSEVRHWPLIGWLCLRAGTLFVARELRADAARVNRQVMEALRNGECIALFPEGTSTDGSEVRHFHSALLQPACDTAIPVQPLALRYCDRWQRTVTAAAYFGDMSFATSLWQVLCSKELHAQVHVLPELPTQGSNRRRVALQARREIAHALAIELPGLHETETLPQPESTQFQSMYRMLLPSVPGI